MPRYENFLVDPFAGQKASDAYLLRKRALEQNENQFQSRNQLAQREFDLRKQQADVTNRLGFAQERRLSEDAERRKKQYEMSEEEMQRAMYMRGLDILYRTFKPVKNDQDLSVAKEFITSLTEPQVDETGKVVRPALFNKKVLEEIPDRFVPAEFGRKLMQLESVLGQVQKTGEPFTLSEGQTRFDASGRQIATVPKQAGSAEGVEDWNKKLTAWNKELSILAKPFMGNSADDLLAMGAFDENGPTQAGNNAIKRAQQYITDFKAGKETDKRAYKHAINFTRAFDSISGGISAKYATSVDDFIDSALERGRSLYGDGGEAKESNGDGFDSWYAGWAEKTGIDPNPDDPRHHYDYRAAYKAGVEPTISKADGKYHWPSQFKADDHPNRFVDGVDTKTGEPKATGNEYMDKWAGKDIKNPVIKNGVVWAEVDGAPRRIATVPPKRIYNDRYENPKYKQFIEFAASLGIGI